MTNNDDFEILEKRIHEIKIKLNRIIDDALLINDEETIQLSQELDMLIIEYMKKHMG